jgi:RimJ/RimL family protein N-acetyltransferase
MRCVFYVIGSCSLEAAPNAVEEPGDLEEWSPSLRKVLPPDAPLWPYCIWWIFHHLRIFKNREYRIVFTRDGDRVIQRSCLLLAFFRFPFMQAADLAVGVWTHPEYRSKGLAARTVRRAIKLSNPPQRKIWYVTKETNLPSIRLAERMGFSLLGKGRRVSAFGFRLFGRFILDSLESPPPSANPRTCVELSAK